MEEASQRTTPGGFHIFFPLDDALLQAPTTLSRSSSILTLAALAAELQLPKIPPRISTAAAGDLGHTYN